MVAEANEYLVKKQKQERAEKVKHIADILFILHLANNNTAQ